MIEFIDDLEVAKALIDEVAEWGRQQGMKKIHGPLGITDFDKEGMLVEDFHLLGSMNTIYNPAYYPKYMEAMGFEKEVDWVQVRVDIPETVPPKYQRVSQYDREQVGLRVIKVKDKDITTGGYGRRIFNLLNEAYQPIFGFTSLSEDQVDGYVKKYLALVDKQLMPIIVNEKDEVVGVAICMGCMSKAMRKARGRLWPFGWYHLLKVLKWKRDDNAEMLLIAVRPDYQGLGVNALFFDDLIPIFNRYGFKWAETGPQLENNVRELTQWKPLHPQFVKRRRCYCKNL
jgi:GNAT superfamily N-acetyltransferase